MSELFFIGDTHFGHKGIIKFSKTKGLRPFKTIEEHDEELVKRWNSVVSPKDDVWHLGDAVFGARNIPIIGRLNGTKRLVMGNHDIYDSHDYLKYFKRIVGAWQMDGMILTHIPVAEEQLERYFMNIHGHLHQKVLDNWRYVNVSCEQTGLTPVPYDEIINRWAEYN